MTEYLPSVFLAIFLGCAAVPVVALLILRYMNNRLIMADSERED